MGKQPRRCRVSWDLLTAIVICFVSSGLVISGYRDPLVGAVLLGSAPLLVIGNIVIRIVNRPRIDLEFFDADGPWHEPSTIEADGFRGPGEHFRVGLHNPTWRTIKSAVTHCDKIIRVDDGKHEIVPHPLLPMRVMGSDDDGSASYLGVDLPKRSTRRHVTVASRFTNGRTGIYLSLSKDLSKLEDGSYELHISATSSSGASGSGRFLVAVEHARLAFRRLES